MKKNAPIMMLLLLPLLAGCAQKPVTLYQVDPLVKVLYCDSNFVDAPDTVCVARGESATFQFVLTADADVSSLTASVEMDDMSDIRIGWVHDVKNTNEPSGESDMISTPDHMYPDPIIDDDEESVAAGSHRSLWIDMDIPRDAKAGMRRGVVTVSGLINGKQVSVRKKMCMQVYPVTLPEKQALKVVNHCREDNFRYLIDDESFDIRSERCWDLFKMVAKAVAPYGQNTWLVTVRPTPKFNADSTAIVYDYTLFDKEVELFQKYGNMQYFCCPYMGGRRDEDWNKPMLFTIDVIQDKTIRSMGVEYTDPRLKEFVDNYFSQLQAHLREKGWLNICYQHIADEPCNMGTENQKSWSTMAGLVKAAAPEMRTIDASFEIIDNQDVSVVLLGNNIDKMPAVPEGRERWMYTCTGPQGNFANRFVQQPLLNTRFLHWINYRWNECGYLHWGLNIWRYCEDPLHNVTPTTNWPGGDCYIIYPGKEKVYPSIRLCAMRDGIHDYDLLRMVEEKDAKKAMEWCQSLILGPDSYDTDIAHFRAVRRQILEYLSH